MPIPAAAARLAAARLAAAVRLAVLVLFVGASAAQAATDELRLDPNVAPVSQSISLEVDPGRDDYSGATRVELEVKKATDTFRFHAQDLELKALRLRGPMGDIALTHTRGEIGLVDVKADRSLAPGRYTLEVDFANRYSTRSIGFYKVKTGGHSYLFTQLQSYHARQAFPCWDEPAFKIPYQISLTVPEGQLAVSNTPVQKETPAGKARRIDFEPTPPTPSYLLAIAVGPFDVVPIPGLSIPGRILTPKGRGHLAAEARDITGPTLKALETWFGTKYPYKKLDLIAAPEFMFGAMENPGAVVFAEWALLIDRSAGVRQHTTLAEFMAHELAHMWFGDLVTMRWWNDLWLNEAFASWLADKIVQQLFPQYQVGVNSIRTGLEAMHDDTRVSTSAVRAEMTARDNPLQFVGLSYDKGEAVLGMFERWMGEETFREGVRRYLAKHRWGNAVAADLWEALGRVSGRDAGQIMTTFIEQPGVPLVTVEPAGNGMVRLTQQRLLAPGATAAPLTWQIPITLKYSAGGRVRTQALLLSEPSQRFKLEGGAAAWIYPNADAYGYYRWKVPPAMLETLGAQATRQLEPRERIALIDNLVALVQTGLLDADQLLATLGHFAHDPRPEVTLALLETLGSLRISFVDDVEGLEAPFHAWSRTLLRPALERIGLEPRPGEADAMGLLRPALMSWLGINARDPEVIRFARQLAERYEKDPGSVDAQLAGAALTIVAFDGDAALFDRFQKQFETTEDPTRRDLYLRALTSFRNPVLAERALEYSVRGPLRPHEMGRIPFSISDQPGMRERVFRWSLEHYDQMSSKVPREFTVHAPWLVGGCSRERLEAAKQFYSDPKRSWPGLKRELSRVEEEVERCTLLRERQGASVARFLGSVKP